MYFQCYQQLVYKSSTILHFYKNLIEKVNLMSKNKQDKNINNDYIDTVLNDRDENKQAYPERDFIISSIIGDKLKSLRKLKKLTLGEAANLSGFSSQALSLCERAKRMPSPKMIVELARVYSCSEDELFNYREETIIDTIRRFGDHAPLSVHNEYQLLKNSREKNRDGVMIINEPRLEYKAEGKTPQIPKTPKDHLNLGAEPATAEELELAKAYLLALRSIKDTK